MATSRRDFFISFNGADLAYAEAIDKALKDAGFSTYFHPVDLAAGGNILVWMDVALDNSAQTLALYSPAYTSDKAVYSKAERYATLWQDPVSDKRKLIPILLQDTIFTPLMASIKYIDVRGKMQADAAAYVVQQLNTGAEQVQRDIWRRGVPLPKIFRAASRPNHNFTGRFEDLESLQQSLRAGTNAAITAVAGMGGIGKTTLAAEYCHRFGGRYGGVWWVRAEQESTMLSDLQTLGQKLEIVDGQSTEADARETLDYLATLTEPWLLVYDNARDAVSVDKWLPAGKTRVIITSRSNDFSSIAKVTHLGRWPDEVTAEYLLKRTGRDDKAGAGRLAKSLGGLPRVAELAAGYLTNHNDVSFDEYRNKAAALVSDEEEEEQEEAEEQQEKPSQVLGTQPTDTQFVPDDAEDQCDALGRGVLAIALARRLHRIWCKLNGAMPITKSALIGAKIRAESGNRTPNNGGSADLEQEETRAAFVMHLDSPWGGGKTTFANFLARTLNPGGYRHREDSFLRRRYGDEPLDTIFLQDPTSPKVSRISKVDIWPVDARRPWIIVPFNAWQVEHVNPPWWVFYQTIRRHCFSAVHKQGRAPVRRETLRAGSCLVSRTYSWLCLLLHEFAWRFSDPKIVALLTTTVLSLVALWLLKYFNIVGLVGDNDEVRISYLLSNSLGFLLAGLSAVSGLWALGAVLTEAILPGSATLNERLSLGYGDPFKRFRNHFHKTMKRLRRPILVIVDDLDRCKPDYIVELIRGMQTLLRSPRVVFLLLGDRDWIERAFETQNEKIGSVNVGTEQTLGGRFAEKAIQLSFVLPGIGREQQIDYVQQLLKGDFGRSGRTSEISTDTAQQLRRAIHTATQTAPANLLKAEDIMANANVDTGDAEEATIKSFVNEELGIRAATDEEVERDVSHRLSPLAPYFPANPRQIKRIINAVTIYSAIALQVAGLSPDDRRWLQLAIWVIIMTEWPRTWRLLATCPAIADFLQAKDLEKAVGSAPATDLLGSKQETLEQVDRLRLNTALMGMITGAGDAQWPKLDRHAVDSLMAFTPIYGRAVCSG